MSRIFNKTVSPDPADSLLMSPAGSLDLGTSQLTNSWIVFRDVTYGLEYNT